MGKKKQPSYRVVVADSRSPRDGRFIETIGLYNPRADPPIVQIKEDRVLYWLSQGAQISDAVARLLKNKGTLDRFARLKEGEDLESLLAEVAAEEVVTEEVLPAEEEEPVEEAVPVEEEEPVEEAAPTEAEVAEELPVAEEEVAEEAPIAD